MMTDRRLSRVVSILSVLVMRAAIALGTAVHVSREALSLERHAEPVESQITPAPRLPGVGANLELKRDGSVICSGYSIVGNTSPCKLWLVTYGSPFFMRLT